jgi:hypothetical protein
MKDHMHDHRPGYSHNNADHKLHAQLCIPAHIFIDKFNDKNIPVPDHCDINEAGTYCLNTASENSATPSFVA